MYLWDHRLLGRQHGAGARLKFTKGQLQRHFRGHVNAGLYDDSGSAPCGTAIYGLSDPRDLRGVRYIGQTGNPRRRLFQHLTAAQLWLPDELPWWVKAPQLRPLSEWIRALYTDGRRLPIMVITQWVATVTLARVEERRRIVACLERGLPLLNVEVETLGSQLLLL